MIDSTVTLTSQNCKVCVYRSLLITHGCIISNDYDVKLGAKELMWLVIVVNKARRQGFFQCTSTLSQCFPAPCQRVSARKRRYVDRHFSRMPAGRLRTLGIRTQYPVFSGESNTKTSCHPFLANTFNLKL